MRKKKKASWTKLVSGAVRLGAAAQTIIALRMAKLAKGGPAARREAKRMVDEKIKAAFNANTNALDSVFAGKALQIPARTLALYHARVRRNLRRLSKKP